MPEIETTPGDFLDDYVKPMADTVGAGGLPYSTFRAAISAVVDLDETISIDIPDPFSTPFDSGSGASVPGPALQPIDPSAVLKSIARAMREAEKLLNTENLAIGGASADVTLVVDIGGIAGATTTFRINVGPTPSP